MTSKIASAADRCQRAAALSGGAILVALSGGKDSLVTLELCAQHFVHVEAFYMYYVRGLDVIERSVDSAARRLGVKVHKVPHPDLTRIMKNSLLRPHTPEASDIKKLKQSDLEAALTKTTGIGWFAYGERASDSFARRLYTRQNDGIRADWKRFYPIWDWLHGDVVSYLKSRRIPLPERFGASDTKVMSGFGLAPRPLHWLKHNAPSDYAKVLAMFPYAEAMVFRYELEQRRKQSAEPAPAPQPKRERARRERKPKPRRSLKRFGTAADEVSEVRDEAGAPAGAQERPVQPAQD